MRGKKIFFEVIAISNIDASQSVNLAAQIPYNFYTKITSINYIKYAMTYIEPLKSEAIHETGLSGNVVPSFFPLIIFIYIYVYISKKNKCMLSTDQFLRLLKIQHATLLFVSFCSFSI